MISASMDEATALGILRAERKLRSGDVAGAQSLCLGLERRSGSMPELDGLFGRIALERGDAEAAVQRIRRAIAADPEAAAYRHALGNALQDQGKLDRAIAAYRRALALRPESAEAWNDLGTPDHDAAAIAAQFEGLPVAGFFCNGEIGPVGTKSFVHGFTASISFFVPVP